MTALTLVGLSPLFIFILSARATVAFTSFTRTHPQLLTPSAASQRQSFPPSTRLLSFSKWDNLVDEDDDDIAGGPPVPFDVKYNERNVMRQHENLHSIRDIGGKELTNDVYVREPSSQTFWFVGKVARVSDVTLQQAVARQWPLIEQHAANLRPIELYPFRGNLEIWTAPGDSELEVAYNRPSIVFEKMEKTILDSSPSNVKINTVGFSGEVYQQGEEGFRTWRTEDGLALNPEVNTGSETRAPTDEEMSLIEEKLQGKDLNELYEEQERRKGLDAS